MSKAKVDYWLHIIGSCHPEGEDPNDGYSVSVPQENDGGDRAQSPQQLPYSKMEDASKHARERDFHKLCPLITGQLPSDLTSFLGSVYNCARCLGQRTAS